MRRLPARSSWYAIVAAGVLIAGAVLISGYVYFYKSYARSLRAATRQNLLRYAIEARHQELVQPNQSTTTPAGAP